MKKVYQGLSVAPLSVSIEEGVLKDSIVVDPQNVKVMPYKDGFEGISDEGFEDGGFTINF